MPGGASPFPSSLGFTRALSMWKAALPLLASLLPEVLFLGEGAG